MPYVKSRQIWDARSGRPVTVRDVKTVGGKTLFTDLCDPHRCTTHDLIVEAYAQRRLRPTARGTAVAE